MSSTEAKIEEKPAVITIREQFRLKPAKRASMLVKNRDPKQAPPNLPEIKSTRLVGIEVEVENFLLKGGDLDRVWSSKADGSLRNNGIEMVTTPIYASEAPHALYNLLEVNFSKDCCFSPRTSVHVHIDMQSEEEAQVKNFVLWYTLFEPLFYRFCGRGRQKNIYCVPLMDTNLLQHFNEMSLNHIVDYWSKYSGLNLIPLLSFGTVEARHMHGTFSYEKISKWIRILCRLADWVHSHEVRYHRELLSKCNEDTDYNGLLFEIFGDDANLLKYKGASDLGTTMHFIKRAFTSRTSINKIIENISRNSAFFKV